MSKELADKNKDREKNFTVVAKISVPAETQGHAEAIVQNSVGSAFNNVEIVKNAE